MPAARRPTLLGVQASLKQIVSYQPHHSRDNTCLTDASIRGKSDPLLGLKENVIIGKIYSAGTGMASTSYGT